MKELTIIRNAVFDFLEGNIDDVAYYHCGHLVFLDAERDLPALCVFIDDAQTDDIDLCGSYWNAKLNIQLYLKSSSPEDDLDELMEQVIEQCQQLELSDLEQFDLSAITYINDDKQTEWIIGAIQYDISFYRKGAE